MSIALSHISALEILRLNGLDKVSLVRVSKPAKLESGLSAAQILKSNTLYTSQIITTPAHIITNQNASKPPNETIITHKLKTIPPRALFRIKDNESLIGAERNILTCSPELCFLQMASTLNLLELIQLGFELCGTYSLYKNHPNGFLPGTLLQPQHASKKH